MIPNHTGQICSSLRLRGLCVKTSTASNNKNQKSASPQSQGYLEELNPQGLEETDLVREVVAGKWRQERYWELETAVNADITNRFDEIDPLSKTAYSLVKQYGHLKALDMVTQMEPKRTARCR
jgi:hypothetical protein